MRMSRSRADEIREQIATASAGVTSARTLDVWEVHAYGGIVTVEQDGLTSGNGTLLYDDGEPHMISAGPDVFDRLGAEERAESGLLWRWRPGCARWADRAAFDAALIRQGSQITAHWQEEHHGEPVTACTLRIRSRGGGEPLLRAAREHLHSHGIAQVKISAWFDTSGRLLYLQKRHDLYRSFRPWRFGGRVASLTTEFWDFGVPVDIRAPSPETVLWPESEQERRLTVLIDQEESPYGA